MSSAQHETRKRTRRSQESEEALQGAFPPGVDSDERAQWIAGRLQELERVLKELEDTAGDFNVNCFARDHLRGTVHTVAPSGLSTDVARAMESEYQLGDLFDLEVQHAKKRRVILERMAAGTAPLERTAAGARAAGAF